MKRTSSIKASLGNPGSPWRGPTLIGVGTKSHPAHSNVKTCCVGDTGSTCGRTALWRVGWRGYCRFHKADAYAARAAYVSKIDASKSEGELERLAAERDELDRARFKRERRRRR